MQLSDAELERFRQSGIRLDAEGRFHHEGEVVAHAGLVAALWRWLDRNPDGRYVLRLDERRFVYLDVDDAPHAVRSLRIDSPDDQGERIVAQLADGTEEVVDPATLRLSRDGVAYCRVKGGRLDARLAAAAFAALADRLVEREGSVRLELGGRSYALAADDPSPAAPPPSP